MVSENKSLLTAKIFVEDQFGALLRVLPKYIKCFCSLNGWIFADHGSNLDTSKSKELTLTSLEIKVLKRIPGEIRLSEISLKFVSCKITESEDFQRVK